MYREETALRAELARRLGEPLGWTVQEVDYVRDLLVVEVRFRQPEPSERPGEFVRTAARRRTTRSRTPAPAPQKETV
ncbi:hypothetical protein [Streptomyces sp. MZ04]|uniref:hypothetical protein n=1 Tax=Streptomyces sp. MZ04 TaxID=2559236 RepID=UPI00107E6AA8|nr:hypothetical protein [Streptomyces sp. MZ04]TGA85065.1 hypothetical protein E2651_42100 [Streptomyces sp. MZ04]